MRRGWTSGDDKVDRSAPCGKDRVAENRPKDVFTYRLHVCSINCVSGGG